MQTDFQFIVLLLMISHDNLALAVCVLGGTNSRWSCTQLTAQIFPLVLL